MIDLSQARLAIQALALCALAVTCAGLVQLIFDRFRRSRLQVLEIAMDDASAPPSLKKAA